MQIALLGPLEVRDAAGRPVDVAGGRLRTLLTRLALDAGRAVPTGALVEAVWGDAPPAEATNALQTLVSRLRRALGGVGAVLAAPGGYRLAVEPDDVDVHRFEHLVRDGIAAGREGDQATARRVLRDALALWRGPALAHGSDANAARLDDLRRAAVAERIEADLTLGAVDGLVSELETLVGEAPLHERFTAQLMRALALTGRQADALARFDRLRQQLADELGVDPSPEVQAVQLAVLRGEVTPAPTKAAPTRRTNLKAHLTSFVGREEQLARIGKALQESRLVTLVGPGGAGKTRLAAEAAAQVDAADGVWLAELAPITDGADVAQAVLGALGLREANLLDKNAQRRIGRDALGRLLDVLADKQVLLVLDNCEHLIDASAALAEQLLQECPDLRVLTTSREPLGITGEQLLAVPPLGHPRPGTPAAVAVQYAAVQLFVDRVAAVRPDFAVQDDNIALVLEIVRRLDGLPLAIELAAARLRTMALSDVAARLSDRFRLLTGGSRTALPRHRTLRAVVGWSWDLLTPQERLLAERLAVFPAGVTADSAEAVCVDDSIDAADVTELLASLVDKSLLQTVGDGHRMRMLETIREFGIERLAERGDLAEAQRRHADHFAAELDEADRYLITRDQVPWLAALEVERDNIVAALRHRCDVGDADGALRIAVQLGTWAMLIGNHAEVATWLGDAIAVPGGTNTADRVLARAMHAMGMISASSAHQYSGADEIAAIAAQVAELPGEAHQMLPLLKVVLTWFAEDEDAVARLLEDDLQEGTPWSRAATRMFRANMAENSGDVALMRSDSETALVEFRALGERWGTASTLRTVATLRTLDGDIDGAISAYEEALTLMHELRSREDEAFAMVRLADLYLRRGDIEGARRCAAQAHAAAEETGSYLEAIFTLTMRASIEREAGRLDLARELDREAEERSATLPSTHPAHSHIKAMVLAAAGRAACDDGNVELARRRAFEAYEAGVATRDLPLLAAVGGSLADLAVTVASPGVAAELLGGNACLRGAEDSTDLNVSRLTTALRATLGDAAFEAAYERGRGRDRGAAIAALDPASWWPSK